MSDDIDPVEVEPLPVDVRVDGGLAPGRGRVREGHNGANRRRGYVHVREWYNKYCSIRSCEHVKESLCIVLTNQTNKQLKNNDFEMRIQLQQKGVLLSNSKHDTFFITIRHLEDISG